MYRTNERFNGTIHRKWQPVCLNNRAVLVMAEGRFPAALLRLLLSMGSIHCRRSCNSIWVKSGQNKLCGAWTVAMNRGSFTLRHFATANTPQSLFWQDSCQVHYECSTKAAVKSSVAELVSQQHIIKRWRSEPFTEPDYGMVSDRRSYSSSRNGNIVSTLTNRQRSHEQAKIVCHNLTKRLHVVQHSPPLSLMMQNGFVYLAHWKSIRYIDFSWESTVSLQLQISKSSIRDILFPLQSREV